MSSRTPLNTITFNRESRFSNQTLPFPEDYLNFGIPIATSSTTFSISKCYARNVTDSYNIYIPHPVTINITNYGTLNGQSIGTFYVDTVRVTSGSSTITSNSPDIYLSLIFTVGDLITIKPNPSSSTIYTSVITEIIDNYNIIISGSLPFSSTTAVFRRGGSENGLVPNTKLFFYALGHTVSPGYILSTRNVMNGDKLVDLPIGYYIENSRQLPYYVIVSGNGVIYDSPIALSWDETSSGITTRFANQEETVKGHEKYKAITPSTLGAAIANLNNISEILGIFASDSDALSMVATTKAVTPANIKQIFNTPPSLGSVTPNTGAFTTLTVSDIIGDAILNTTNIDPTSSKLITMNTLSSALQYATKLGSSSNYVSSAYVDELNIKTLSGSGIVSSLGSTYSNPQKSMPTDINHVLSVAGSVQLLSQPTAIGNNSPNTGNFTSLTAKTIYGQVGDSNTYSTGRFSSLTVDSISGNFVASNQDAINMSSSTKVLTPSTIPTILSNPSDIGNITPSTGTFTTLKADSLAGGIVASDIDALNKTSTTKCITPKTIATILADPGTIGSKNPGVGKFSSITVDNITVANSLTLLKPNGFSFGYMVTCIPRKITPIGSTSDGIAYFSIRYCYARNETNNADIILNTSTVVDIYGSNGMINGMCRSAPLGGTVSVISGSNVVYGTGNCNFAVDFILGDTVSIGSEIKRITGINSNSNIVSQHLIVDSNFQNTYSGVGYYRGGSGLGSLASNMYYHIYILGNNLTTGLGTPGYVVSTRNVMDGDTLVDLPSGYSLNNYRQLPYSFYSDSTGLLSTDASPYFAKDSSSGAFLRPAKDQEVIDKKLTYVSVTPASLPKVMANPGPIGSDIPSTGTFTTLVATKVAGQCIASNSEAVGVTLPNKVIVPSAIPYIFASPPALGTTVPAKGTFTILQANQITGNCIATDDEARLKTSTTKLITPSSLSLILASPGVIGGTTASDANFKTVNASTVNSNIINVPSTGAVNISADANFNGALYGNVISANKYLGIIGDPVSKNNAYFTNLQADAISGPFMANTADIIARTSTNKLVTPANLQTLFENPPVIGKTTPTTGYFTSIHADSITVAYPISQRAQLPVMYMTSSDVYTTNYYEFTIQYCYARSLDDSLDILISIPKTINIRNQNVINGMCKSTAMPGTVNVASGSNVVSGNNTTFSYTFIVGDVISLGGQSYLVNSIDSNSQTLIVDRSVHFTSLSSVYYRGGTDTLLPNKIYYFYAVGHSTTPCYMISTRSTDIGETLVDLPTGYNVAYSRQIPYAVQTNSTGTISDQPRPLSSFESSSSITQVASNLEAIQKLNTFKALTPSNIPSFMSVPGPIGNQTPSTGSFTDLTANTIGGSCIANLTDMTNGVNNKIVTPASLTSLFDSPSTIGSQSPNDAFFNSLITYAPVQVNDNSPATNYNNASIITKGGLSVTQNILVGTTLTTEGKSTFKSDVAITSTAISNSSTTGALTVAGGVGIKGDLNVNGSASFNSLSLSGNFNIPSTTQSTTTTDGAFTVAGGIGIKGNIVSGGQTLIKNTTDTNNTTNGALIVSGGTGIQGNAIIGGNVSAGKDFSVSGQSYFTNTTESNATNNGSLIVNGGIGIAKSLTVGGSIKTNSDSVFNSTTESTSNATGSLTTKGGLGVAKNAFIGGQMKVESTTQSTSVGTGSLVVSGGAGVSKNLTVGGNISTSGSLSIGGSFSINSGFDSNDTLSGALIITGGVGISGSTNMGGNINIGGTSTSKSVVVTSTQKANTSGSGAVTVAGGIGIGDNSTFAKNVNILGGLTTTGQSTILNNTSSALSVTGGAVIGTTLFTGSDVTVGGTTTIAGSTKITSTTSSTSTETGALIVSGGVAIKENLSVAGGLNVSGAINMANINITGTTSSTNSSTGALKVAGGISTQENMYVNQNLNVNGKSIFIGDSRINSVTSSTSASTGALTIAGGLGVTGDIYLGNNINVGTNAVVQGTTTLNGSTNVNNILNITGKTSITDTTQSTSTTSGALTVAGGAGVKGALMVGGTTNLKGFTTIEAGTSITNTTNAVDSTSGALTVAGGLGITKDSHFGGNTTIYGLTKSKNTTNSIDTTTGAVVVDGGIGIQKDVHIGGSLYSENTAYLGGIDNGVKLTGGLSGTTPFIKSYSDKDTNVDLKIQPQGFGRTYVVSDLIVTGSFSAASITGVNPSAALPRGYFYISRPPIYLTTSTYNIPDVIARNYNNSANLFVNATNVSMNNLDVINGIMTTVLNGTVSVTSGSTSITGIGTAFSTDFVNGDIININFECQVIAEIVSDTSLIVANPYSNTYSNESYKLNGKCPNANYYVYLVNNATSSNPGYILTSKVYTEGQTLLSVPTGYSNIDYRIIPYKLTTDSTGNFVQTPTSLSGGLGVSNMTKGSLIVGTSSGGAQTLKVGTDGQILSLSNGVPTWITGSFDSSSSYKITGTTEATSSTTGALLVEGGVGIKGSLYVGGDLGLDGANFNTIEGSVVAHNSDLTLSGSSPDNLVITPLGLYNVLTSPPVIGDLVQNDAKFTDIRGNTVSGNMIATSSDINSSGPNTKIITPFILADFIANPTIDIGSNGRSNAYFDNIDINSISGSVFSILSDFGSTPSTKKVVSPSMIKSFLSQPSDIGTVSTANAYFKELGFTSIASTNIASLSDMQTGTSNSVILTPTSIDALFKSPIAFGSIVPNSGKFTTLNANVYYGSIGSSSTYNNAFIDTLNAKNISGDLIPTDITDLKTNNSNSKVVTPYLLSQYFTSLPSIIGDGSTNAIFDTVTVNSLAGSVFATNAGVIAGSSSNTIVSPSALKNLLTSNPPNIGDTNPAAGVFTTLNANQIYGQLGSTNNKSNVYSAVLYFDEFNPNSGGIGTMTDVQQGTAGKFIDTSVIKDLFASPLSIGSTTASAGTFSLLKATSASLTNALPTTSGGTGLSSYITGDLLYGSASNTLSSLSIGTENQFLKVNSGGIPEWSDLPTNYSTLNISDTAASTSTQTGALVVAGGVGIGGDVNVNGYLLANSIALTSPLSVDSGGLGLSSVNNGDLLVGSTSNKITKLSAGSNGQILSLSSGKPAWTNAPSTTSTTNLTITNSSGTTLSVSSNENNAVSVTGGITANSLVLTTALPVTSGGTGLASVVSGDLIYGSASNILSSLAKGMDGQILTLASGFPAWTSAISVTGGISANSLVLTTALPVTSGGTGLANVVSGDLIYGSASNILSSLAKGTDGQILTVVSGKPAWTNATTNLSITNGSGTTLSVSSNASNAISVTGGISANSLVLTTALPVTSGGTGLASVASGDIVYGSASNTLSSLAKGTNGQILTLASGFPAWTNAPSTTSTTSLSITNTTSSSSSSSGALIIAGGAGIGGNINSGGNGNIGGQLSVNGNISIVVAAPTVSAFSGLSFQNEIIQTSGSGSFIRDFDYAGYQLNASGNGTYYLPSNTSTYASSSWTVEIAVHFVSGRDTYNFITSTNSGTTLNVRFNYDFGGIRWFTLTNGAVSSSTSTGINVFSSGSTGISFLVLQWTGTQYHLTFIDRYSSTSPTTYTATINSTVNYINNLTVKNDGVMPLYIDFIRISNKARYVDGSGNLTSVTFQGCTNYGMDNNTLYLQNFDNTGGANGGWSSGTLTASVVSTDSTTGALVVASGGIGITGNSYFGNNVNVTGGLTLGTALPVTSGGTGLTGISSGDLVYGSASNTLSSLTKGTNGQILSLSSGLPSWINVPSTTSTTNLSITNGSGTTLSISSNASNAISVTGGISANSLALTTALPVTSGGTGLTVISSGDLVYGSASNTLSSLTKGTNGQILSLSSGLPSWINVPSTTSTTNLNITNGTGTTLSVSSNANNAISVTGGISANSLALTTALPVTSGGTGLASVASGDLVYGSASNTLSLLAKGSDGQILSLASGFPAWTNAPSTTSTTSLSITNTTSSTSFSSGALIIAGGAGIGGNINSGGNGSIAGQLSINGSIVINVPTPTFTSTDSGPITYGSQIITATGGVIVANTDYVGYQMYMDKSSGGTYYLPSNSSIYGPSAWTLEIAVMFTYGRFGVGFISSTSTGKTLNISLNYDFSGSYFSLSDGTSSTTTSMGITTPFGSYGTSFFVLQWTGSKYYLHFRDRAASYAGTVYSASIPSTVNFIDGLKLKNNGEGSYYVDFIRISNIGRYSIDGSDNLTVPFNGCSTYTMDNNTLYFQNFDNTGNSTRGWSAGTLTTSSVSTNSTTGALVVASGGIGITGNSYFGNNLNVTGGLTLGTALPITSGGTGLASITSGDLIYGSASNTLSSLAKGTDGQILSLASGLPSWTNVPSTTSTTNLSITNTTLSTSTNTGSLIVNGGMGVQGTANINALALPTTTGTTLTVSSTQASSSTSTGAVTIVGGLGVQGTANINALALPTTTGTTLTISSTQASSSTSTGAVTIAGGVGIQGTANINILTLPTTTGTTLAISSTTNSTSTSTGSVTLAGGIGIKGSAFINSLSLPTTTGTTLAVSSTQTSTNTTTGAVTIAGGIGIQGNVYTGGNENIAGQVTVGGSIVTSVNVPTLTNPTGVSYIVANSDGVSLYGATYVLKSTTSTNSSYYLPSNSGTYATSAWTVEIPIYISNNGGTLDFITATNGGNTLTVRLQFSPKKFQILLNGSLISETTAGFTVGGSPSASSLFILQWTGSNYHVTYVDGYAGQGTIYTATAASSVNFINNLIVSNQTGAVSQYYLEAIRISNKAKYVDGSGNNLTTGVSYAGAGNYNTLTSDTIYVQTFESTGSANQGYQFNTVTTSVTSTSTSTGALVISSGGIGVSGNSYFGGSINLPTTTGTNFVVSSTQASSSTTSGAVTIAGGIGISGAAYINTLALPTTTGTTLTISSTQASSSTTTGALIITGGTGIGGALNVGGNQGITGTLSVTGTTSHTGAVTVTSAAVSSSTTTGALIITGGTGIGGALNVGGNQAVTGTFTSTGAATMSSTLGVTGATTLSSTLGVSGTSTLAAINASGAISTSNATASTSTTTGALIATGGAGIGGNLNVGGYIGRGKRTAVSGATYTILENDYLIAITVTTAVALTLPSIATLTNKAKLYIIKAETATPNITITCSATDTLDGQASFVLDGDYNALSIYCDGTSKWFIF